MPGPWRIRRRPFVVAAAYISFGGRRRFHVFGRPEFREYRFVIARATILNDDDITPRVRVVARRYFRVERHSDPSSKTARLRYIYTVPILEIIVRHLVERPVATVSVRQSFIRRNITWTAASARKRSPADGHRSSFQSRMTPKAKMDGTYYFRTDDGWTGIYFACRP